MSPNLKSGIIAAVVALVVALVVGYLHMGNPSLFGSITQSGLSTYAPANSSAFTGPYGVESDAGFFDAAGAASALLGSLSFNSNTSNAGPTLQGYGGSCNTASTTLFAIGPITATSTWIVWGTIGGNATTSSLYVGTSTTPNGITTGTNIIASSNGIATGTVQGFFTGQTLVPPEVIASANSYASIVVVPKQYIDAYSTSTATGGGAAGYSPTESTCSYKALQVR